MRFAVNRFFNADIPRAFDFECGHGTLVFSAVAEASSSAFVVLSKGTGVLSSCLLSRSFSRSFVCVCMIFSPFANSFFSKKAAPKRGGKKPCFFFFYPDYTVGLGIAPSREKVDFRLSLFFADYTAGGELHPAPKISIKNFYLACRANSSKLNRLF